MVRADDDAADLAPAGKQDADLAVYSPGKLAKLPRQLAGHDAVRRHAPLVEFFQLPDFGRRQAGQFTIDTLDNGSLAPFIILASSPSFFWSKRRGGKSP